MKRSGMPGKSKIKPSPEGTTEKLSIESGLPSIVNIHVLLEELSEQSTPQTEQH